MRLSLASDARKIAERAQGEIFAPKKLDRPPPGISSCFSSINARPGANRPVFKSISTVRRKSLILFLVDSNL